MILLFVIGACILCFLVMTIYSRIKVGQEWKSTEEEAVAVSKNIYNTLSLPQRYAFLFILDIFIKNIRGSVKDLAIAIHQIRLEAKALGVENENAEAFFQAEGMERGFDHAMKLLYEIKGQDKRITDFLIYRSHFLVEKAGGFNQQSDISSKELSDRLFLKIFGSLGYTEKELNDIVQYPDELINIFGRNKLI